MLQQKVELDGLDEMGVEAGVLAALKTVINIARDNPRGRKVLPIVNW